MKVDKVLWRPAGSKVGVVATELPSQTSIERLKSPRSQTHFGAFKVRY